MHPATAHDCIKAFRPLNKHEARAVLDNPGLGWAPGTEDEARALIAAENARMGGGIIPHPDRVIEVGRPRPEADDNRGHVMLGWVLLAVCVVGALLIAWTLWLATVIRVEMELRVTPEAAIALMEGQP